jgi:hypothetical protein
MSDLLEDEPLARMIRFVEEIGLATRRWTLDANTSLPGLAIDRGVILIDVERLSYPGDLLHEAGHLAVTAAASRQQFTRDSQLDLGDDLGAIAWSYAAALHLGIDPAIVFHEHGYQGSSAAFLSNFANGHYVGVPLLAWAGMTVEPRRGMACNDCYPMMLRWLRE